MDNYYLRDKLLENAKKNLEFLEFVGGNTEDIPADRQGSIWKICLPTDDPIWQNPTLEKLENILAA